MVDVQAVKAEIERKTGLSRRQVNRLVSKKADDALIPLDIAALALAKERGVSLQRLATPDELTLLRAASNGNASPQSTMASSAPSVPPAQAVGPRRRAKTLTPSRPTRGRTVFVVHGRNTPLKDALFDLLRALDLKPLEWNSGIKDTGLPSPTVKQIVDVLFSKAVAVIVLLTPDDVVKLKPQLRKAKGERKIEAELTGQARPNVLFEAGMALSSHPEATVLVQIGDVKPFTDVEGIHIVHMDNSPERRLELVTKLQNAGCSAKTDGTDWLRKGDFEQETY